MFDAIKDFLNDLLPTDSDGAPRARVMDKKLCAAALMAQAIAIDGQIMEEEQAKLLQVLETHYDLTPQQAAALAAQAREAQEQSVDLYGFTSQIKAQMDETERLGLIEDMWEMVYADGELHEFEDNLVWRVAELINIPPEKRMALKRLVRDRATGV